MSWQIREDSLISVIILEGELSVQNAADFYRAVVPLASSGRPVRIDASAAKHVHTSVMQTLYALSQAVEDFGVTAKSDEFRLAETRVGFELSRLEK